ncbi:hypothetical protein F7Q99_35955 [Streptomyces kaniharaensis]|uniref:Tetratricopeptide repeat protein n=1 Tax=Streptomyces kaniharaensis TaxID=212423 RepID=A0A6N7L0B7_9ACTN|nr:hypothetical protein [Streptomyces kaniharaensis]MQS17436.1 hypothetical protein [Streptomyces kaniharaensis]
MTDSAAPPEDLDPILQLARTALADGDHDGAAELFEQAARAGTPGVLGKIAEAYAEMFDGRAADWMSRAVAAMSVPGGITVHPGTLRIIAQHGVPEQQVWSVTVRSSDEDRPAVVTALEAAVPRLMRITHDGRELTDGDMDAALASGVDFYSPNYAAVDTSVPKVWLDCKDAVLPAMALAVIRVLADEFDTAGVRQAGLCTPATKGP